MDKGDCYLPLIIRLPDYRKNLGIICGNFWKHPEKKLTIIGITGTKGKTTVSYMTKKMLESGGFKIGIVGTVEIYDGETSCSSRNTTPSVIDLYRVMHSMVENSVSHCILEVSSQALMQGRVSGIKMDVALFTNLSPDHVGKDEHRFFEEYARWKTSLFLNCNVAVLNEDDTYYPMFEQAARSGSAKIIKYSLKDGMDIGLAETGMPGKINVYNYLAASVVAERYGVSKELRSKCLDGFCVRGRMEKVKVPCDFTIYIDYAHNGLSLQNALSSLREGCLNRIICVFGCGGNRSKSRRYHMGEVAGELADFTVVTSDNPRYENPFAIMEDIEQGIKKTRGKYTKIEDRKEAIRYAMREAEEGDIILLAGKGHETYQEIYGQKTYMDERDLIHEILEEEDECTICGCDNRHITRGN
jgi:UDP-N-acetylmuramoyl-L-alanyl-D-glutamate--2,6-diaminopimelate ligase